jgi:endonuclease/exonuclease/phosphatase family metal-dependent hydrolase
MLTFLFWNMGGKGPKRTPEEVAGQNAREARLLGVLRNLAEGHGVDLVILAECPVEAGGVLEELNRGMKRPRSMWFRENDSDSLCERILIFPRFSSRFLLRRSEGPRYTGRLIKLPDPRPSLILFAVHFGSKLHKSEASQTLAAPVFSHTVRDLEKKSKHDRTLVVGDFNMNPFEDGIVGAEGLNAAMSRRVAAKEGRTVDRAKYPFFYNPMWSFFGDSTHADHPPSSPQHEPPGTCYFPAAESRWYYWNIFDQVLLRPSLLPWFNNKDLQIVTGDGTTRLINADGLPDSVSLSDHLPILFRLNV